MFSKTLDLLKEELLKNTPYLMLFWEFVKVWWWVVLPFILWRPFTTLWRWWRIEIFLKQKKRVIFEIKIPKDTVKPIRAMETVIDGLWQILYDPPGIWWEKWIEGKVLLSYSFDLVSIEGNLHFFLRAPEDIRHSIESSIYSQYPEAEISIVDDYTKKVPQDIPNKKWDIWGADFRLLKEDPYPIRTYRDFETENERVEEKRIDPLSILLEASTKIGKGEQLWIQILACPVTDGDFPWITEGERIRDEIVGRKKSEPPYKSFLKEAIDILFFGNPPSSSGEESEEKVFPSEMTLTPGEKEVISAIERKISKKGFKCSARFIYLGKRDVFFKPKIRLPLAFFSAFNAENLNMLLPYGQPLITKIPQSWFLPLNLLRERRLYLRQRRMFRHYINRVNPFYPKEKAGGSGKRDVFVLNTEELATIYHFPSKLTASAPFIERIEHKKGGAPPSLPIE